jgi:hypothetical protein
MKIIDIANNIDKTKENKSWIKIDDIISEFDITVSMDLSYALEEQTRLKCFWVGRWYCTDTDVGYRMYYLDDVPVAFSVQTGRKNDENIWWFSNEAFTKVKEYMLELIKTTETKNVRICDINEDIGEGYQIDYNRAILEKDRAMLNGERITIIERIKDNPDRGLSSTLKILQGNGEEKIVDASELEFQYNLRMKKGE